MLALIMLLLLLIPAGMGEAGNGGQAGERVRLINLDQAMQMAREAGPTLDQVRVEFGLAESRLDIAKGNFPNVGSYYDSRDLRKDIDELEKHIDKKLDEIRELNQEIEAWREEQEELEQAGETAEASRLESKISRANQDKAVLEQELLDIRRPHGNMIVRYHQMKAAEDAARPTLDPLELASDAAADEVIRQPDLLDYRVQNIFLNLLAMENQAKYQEMMLENQQRMLEREKVMLELGMSTALRLAQTESAVEQVAEGGERLQAEIDNLKRDFAILLGLPLDSAYALVPVTAGHLDVGERWRHEFEDAPAPDLTQSLSYLRAIDVLQRRELDLDETGTGDRKKYREAELNVEKAQLDLEMTINSLQTDYQGAREQLDVADKGLRNANLSLQIEEKNFARAELEYSLGIISRMELEQKELSLQEAQNKQQEALNQHYLAYHAYLLAREGIMI